MLERLHFLVLYVGSAALVAFLAVCLSAPRVSTFECHPRGANGAQGCELVATLPAAAPEAVETSLDGFTAAEVSSPALVAVASAH